MDPNISDYIKFPFWPQMALDNLSILFWIQKPTRVSLGRCHIQKYREQAVISFDKTKGDKCNFLWLCELEFNWDIKYNAKYLVGIWTSSGKLLRTCTLLKTHAYMLSLLEISMNQDSKVLRQPLAFIECETQRVCLKIWIVVPQRISYKVRIVQNAIHFGSASNYFQESKNLKKDLSFFPFSSAFQST